MKIAILHEMLIKLGGAEKVVKTLCDTFPNADLFTLIYDEKKVGSVFPKRRIKMVAPMTQRIYAITGKQRLCLPMMSLAVESLDFSNYDTVIVSSSGFAHGLITKPETKTIIYYHSPARYLWDWSNEYKRDIRANKGIKGFLLNSLFLRLRKWDYIAAQRNDILIANSKNVQRRIQKYYRRESSILYPPVEIARFKKRISVETNQIGKFLFNPDSYFIIVSALTEFKKIEIAINHFKKSTKDTLVIVGDGNFKKELETLANKKSNIHFLGAQYGNTLVSLIQNSKALIFPGEEDFGIVPIEAMAAGKPIFAYHGGGLTETVVKDMSGDFFYEKDGSDFSIYFNPFIEKIERGEFNVTNIQIHASTFDELLFKNTIIDIVNK